MRGERAGKAKGKECKQKENPEPKGFRPLLPHCLGSGGEEPLRATSQEGAESDVSLLVTLDLPPHLR